MTSAACRCWVPFPRGSVPLFPGAVAGLHLDAERCGGYSAEAVESTQFDRGPKAASGEKVL